MDGHPGDIPFETLLVHRQWVRNLARSLVADPNLADELEQRTWMAALRRPPRSAQAARGWLGRVVRNFAHEHHRAEGRLRDRQEISARSEAEKATDDIVATAELQQLVVRAVLDLEGPYREIILLRFFEGLKPAAVAARLKVPAETVRTRQRRALAQLRERFEHEQGDHRRFLSWLAPLIAIPASSVSAASLSKATTVAGGSAMLFAKLSALILMIGAGIVGISSWIDDGPEEMGGTTRPERPTGTSASSADDEGQKPVRTEPFRESVQPVATPPREQPEAEVPPSGKATAPGTGLALRLRVKPDVLRVGEPAVIEAIFWNDGTKPVKFFLPEFAGMIPFPHIRLTDGKGRRYACETPAFQSMWTLGFQGGVIELAPGEEHVVKNDVRGFAPVDEKSGRAIGWTQRATLPAGEYRLEATYSQERAAIPFSKKAFEIEFKPTPGLWIGILESIPSGLIIQDTDEPVFAIETKEDRKYAGSLELSFTIRNPSLREYRGRGKLKCCVTRKGSPPLTTILRLDPRAAQSQDLVEFAIPAGKSTSWSIDLADPVFEQAARPHRRGKASRGHLRNILHEGLVAVTVTFLADGVEPGQEQRSNLVFVRLPDLPDLATRGLKLEATPTSVVGTAVPTIDLRLHNESEETLTLPGDLHIGRDIHLALHKLLESAVPMMQPVPPGFELTGPSRQIIRLKNETGNSNAPGADDFATLAPGSAFERRLNLQSLLAEPLSPGRYELAVVWRNVEDGRHLRPAHTNFTVGILRTKPVLFTIAE